MTINEELRKIKKKYGEKFMHMCRDLFPTILEEEGVLFSILEERFADNSRSLYEDIQAHFLQYKFENFINSIYIKRNSQESGEIEEEGSTPYELLDEAGYTLYECTNEQEIQEFKKYYATGESLCTFNGGRLNRCVVFFAVKKNVDEIKRENFANPEREDEYGTSVMSIQFTKVGKCIVSIKNRYNHMVGNPDATYGNDLNRIIPGLTDSFARLLQKRDLYLDSSNIEKFEIPSYVVTAEGMYYKYNIEINGRYFCPGNIVIDYGQAIKVGSPEKKVLIENFIIDLVNKTVTQYGSGIFKDSFTDALTDIERIEIMRDKAADNGDKIITIKRKNVDVPVEIRVDKDNSIIGYINMGIKEAGDSFLLYNKKLKDLSVPSLESTGANFLGYNAKIQKASFPKLKRAGVGFLLGNRFLTEFQAPNLEEAEDSFLHFNEGLTELDLPKLRKIGDKFLFRNTKISRFNFPNVETIGDSFSPDNFKLEELILPKVTKIGSYFMIRNSIISKLEAPNLSEVKDYFLYSNMRLRRLSLPKLVFAGNAFLYNNSELEEINMPALKVIGSVGNVKILAYQSSKPVTPTELSKLDKESEMTESEISSIKRVIGKIKDMLTHE